MDLWDCGRGPHPNHNLGHLVFDSGTQRPCSEEMTDTASELQDTGTKITGMRDAQMRDMNDYIRAYSEMGALLDTYDRQLHRINDMYNEAQKRDKRLLRVDRRS